MIGLFPVLICTRLMFPISSMRAEVPCGVLHFAQLKNWNSVTGVGVVLVVDVILDGRRLCADSSR